MNAKEFNATYGMMSATRDVFARIIFNFEEDLITSNTARIAEALLNPTTPYSLPLIEMSVHYENKPSLTGLSEELDDSLHKFLALKLLLPSLDLRKTDHAYLINKPLIAAYIGFMKAHKPCDYEDIFLGRENEYYITTARQFERQLMS